jgi:hypothetical protein
MSDNEPIIDASWYQPGASIQEFHQSGASIRGLVGGRGSGKTTSIAVETAGHAFHNAGSKIYILRKTQESNTDTTLETFEKQVFPQLGKAYTDTGISLFKRTDGGKHFRLPSRVGIEKYNAWLIANPTATKANKLYWLESIGDRFCSHLYFAGVPEARYRASRFRGYECSLLIFVEADQLDKEDLDLGMACLRWKGADPERCDEKGFIKDRGCILDTNPPSPRHWIAELEKDAKETGDSSVKFWHIPTEENRHNLPDGYVESLRRQYRKNPAMFKRMLLGQYAEAFDGSPVIWGFNEDSAFEDLGWPQGAYLIRGWDFGSTNAVIWSAYWEYDGHEYWWDLYEHFAIMSDTEKQCRSVIDITNTVFPFWNKRGICAGLFDYCDPAGFAKTDKGRSVDTLHSNGIFPGSKRMGLQDSLTIYNRLMEKTDGRGQLTYRIDKKWCPMLYVAQLGGYRYPVEGEPGFGKDTPLKGPAGGNYDHVVDAGRYAKINQIRQISAGDETKKKPVGPLAYNTKVNRKRRYH